MEHFWNKMEQQKPCIFVMLVSLILLFSIEFVNGQEVEVNYPNEVEAGQEFDVNVELADFTEDIYDVKIDIFCSEERISRIFDEADKKWKSTNYYIYDIVDFPSKNKESFNLNITKECEKADLSVSIRNSKDSVKKFSNYSLVVEKAEIENKPEDEVKEEETDNEEITKQESEEEVQLKNQSEENISENIESEQITTSSVIKLNANTQDSKVYKSRSEYIKQYAVYGFAVFLAIILIALIIHGRRKN